MKKAKTAIIILMILASTCFGVADANLVAHWKMDETSHIIHVPYVFTHTLTVAPSGADYTTIERVEQEQNMIMGKID